jgi:hypothetical protein
MVSNEMAWNVLPESCTSQVLINYHNQTTNRKCFMVITLVVLVQLDHPQDIFRFFD